MIRNLKKVLFIGLLFTLCSLPITAQAKTQITATGYDDLESKLSDAIISGETEIDIDYKSPLVSPSGDMSKLFSWGGLNLADKKDIDYVFYNINSIELNWSGSPDSQGYWAIGLRLNTKSSSEENAYVKNEITNILNNNDFTDYSDYDKHAWIYNYIVTNVAYDYSLKMDTAYDALHDKKTICGGFSSLYYLMSKELGLSCKIAYGQTENTLHAWNLVELDGERYYSDTTWGSYFENNDYLLKAKASLTTHTIDNSFNNETINFADSDYKPGITEVTAKNLTVVYGKSKKLNFTVQPTNASATGLKFKSANTAIATVNSKGVVKGIKSGKTYMYVYYGSKKTKVAVTVKEYINSKYDNINIHKGKTKSLANAVIISSKGYKDLKYKTANSKVATVSKKGVIKGMKKGTCDITVYDKLTNKKITTIKVKII